MPKDIENKIKSQNDTALVIYETKDNSETKVIEHIGNTIYLYKTKYNGVPDVPKFDEWFHLCECQLTIPEGYIAIQKGIIGGYTYQFHDSGIYSFFTVQKPTNPLEIPVGTLIATLQLIKVENISLVKQN
jgi:hypothetical protein